MSIVSKVCFRIPNGKTDVLSLLQHTFFCYLCFFLYIMCLITLQPWIRPATSIVMERNFPIKDLAICTKEYCKTICRGITKLVSGSVWLFLIHGNVTESKNGAFWRQISKLEEEKQKDCLTNCGMKKAHIKEFVIGILITVCHQLTQSILDQTLGHNMVIFFIEFRY